jgi:NADPH:quinone reductase-like Zn-dependent oxidoreductase
MCLSVQSGGGFEAREAPRRSPGVDEIEIAVEAASVNPIDVRRADGYGRRRLSLLAASRLPMTLGNSLLARSSQPERVAKGFLRSEIASMGSSLFPGTARMPPIFSRMGAYARKAPPDRNIRDLAALPYSFVTIWLAARAAGLTRDNTWGRLSSCMGRRRQGDQAKKGGCGRVCGGGAALHVGFVQAGSGKHLLKWLGSSSYDGSISRLGLRRRPRHPCRL